MKRLSKLTIATEKLQMKFIDTGNLIQGPDLNHNLYPVKREKCEDYKKKKICSSSPCDISRNVFMCFMVLRCIVHKL